MQQARDLPRGKVRHSDDEIGIFGCLARLLREAPPEIRRRVISGHDKQVMKRRDYFLGWPRIHALIQRVEQIGFECGKAWKQQAPPDIWLSGARGAPQLFCAVAMQEAVFRIRHG